MFESAELGHMIDKDVYKKAVPAMRADLLDAQYDLKEQGKIPVIVLVSGQDGAGKGETINILYEWMDPRFISTLAFSTPTDEERERPYMWRYWRALPPKGRIGIFELLPASAEICKLIVQRADANAIRSLAIAQGMRLLREDGWQKACQGGTDAAEVLRVTREES